MIASQIVCRPAVASKRHASVSVPKARRAVAVRATEEKTSHGPLFYIGNAHIDDVEEMTKYMEKRTEVVTKAFPGSLGIDDYMSRVESVLYGSGFTGENSLAISNMCRDEATNPLRAKVENIFGNLVFSFQSLGGIPTAGVIGMGAGLSHAPTVGPDGKESYVFFSFPHISVDETGAAGPMARAARPASSACGALIGALGALQKDANAACACGEHDPMNPEFTILVERISSQMKDEGKKAKDLDLVDFTKLTERLVTSDMETLIEKSVEGKNANYAVVTGVHIHSWTKDYNDDGPKLEFVYPTNFYTVIDGVKKEYDISEVAPLTPRQISLLCSTEGKVPSVRVAGTPKSVAKPAAVGLN